MNQLQRSAMLLSLLKNLKARGSWCGETHLQKATYFLQQLTLVPLGFEFVLYKHGPYSFDLSDTLTAMRADSLLKLEVRDPYGPSFAPSVNSEQVEKRCGQLLEHYQSQVSCIAQTLGNKKVAELERLATALYVTKQEHLHGVELRAARINELKPHIPVESAQEAVNAVDQLIQEAQELPLEATVG